MDQRRRCFWFFKKRIFNQPTARVRSLCTGETPLRMTFRVLLNQIESMNHAVSNRGRSKNPGSRLNLLVNFSYHF